MKDCLRMQACSTFQIPFMCSRHIDEGCKHQSLRGRVSYEFASTLSMANGKPLFCVSFL